MTGSVSVAGRLLVAAGCIAASQASIWHLEHRTRQDAAEAAKFSLERLPTQFDEWTGSDTEIDKRLVRHIGSLTEPMNRRYDDRKGNRVAVHMASFPTAEMSIPHPPELCYTNAGWKIVESRLESGEGGWKYRILVVENETERALVAYWYQLGDAVASNREEFRAALQKLRGQGRRWPPLIKVLMHVPITLSPDQTLESVEPVGAAIYDWVSKNS